MKRKTYQSIGYPKLHAEIEVDGKGYVVEFTGSLVSQKYSRNGIFITENEKIQKALEADSGFNKDFRLIETTDSNPIRENIELQRMTYKKELEEEQVSQEIIEAETKPIEKEPSDPELVHEITNTQTAKRWLADNKGAVITKLNDKKSVLDYAKSVNVKFPDWI